MEGRHPKTNNQPINVLFCRFRRYILSFDVLRRKRSKSLSCHAENTTDCHFFLQPGFAKERWLRNSNLSVACGAHSRKTVQVLHTTLYIATAKHVFICNSSITSRRCVHEARSSPRRSIVFHPILQLSFTLLPFLGLDHAGSFLFTRTSGSRLKRKS